MRFSAILLACFAFWFEKPKDDFQLAEGPEQYEQIIESETLVADDRDQVEPAKASAGLALVNKQRKTRSLGPLVSDANLEALALKRATKAASGRLRGHLGGSISPASKEGIGYGPGRVFRACYQYTAPAGTKAGAAIVEGSDGMFYSCLLLDHPGSLSTGKPKKRRFKLFRFRR